MSKLRTLQRGDGQTMAEYGVILAVITSGIILALGLLSGAILGLFQAAVDVI